MEWYGAGSVACFISSVLFQRKITTRHNVLFATPLFDDVTEVPNTGLAILKHGPVVSPSYMKMWSNDQTVAFEPVYGITRVHRNLSVQQVGSVATLEPQKTYIGSFLDKTKFPVFLTPTRGAHYIPTDELDTTSDVFHSGQDMLRKYAQLNLPCLTPVTTYTLRRWHTPETLYFLGHKRADKFYFHKYSSCPTTLVESEIEDDTTINLLQAGKWSSIIVGVTVLAQMFTLLK